MQDNDSKPKLRNVSFVTKARSSTQTPPIHDLMMPVILLFFNALPTCVTAQSTATGLFYLFPSSGHSFCRKHLGKFSHDTL